MKVLLKDLPGYDIQKLIICSLEQALYQAIVVIDGEEHLVWETESKGLRSRNLLKIREQFELLSIPEAVLRHESPYDEMIGQENKTHSNRLEVPLSTSLYTAENRASKSGKNPLLH